MRQTTNPYAELLRAVQTKCEQQHWYAGSLVNPYRYPEKNEDSRTSHFLFPLASEERLRATEAALGFALPPLLRVLYKELANGGFGPGGGVRGALGGHGTPRDPDEPDETIVGRYSFKKRMARLVGRIEDAGEWTGTPQQTLLLPDAIWPLPLLPLCDMGCLSEICVHIQTHKIFLLSRVSENLSSLTLDAPSLQAWLVKWVSD